MRHRPGQRADAGPRARRAGFTLLELLVAVSILALIAIIAWRGLSSLTQTRERLAPQNEAVHAVLAGFGQMERDLAQVPVNTNLFALPTQAVHLLSIDGHASLQILRLAESPDGSPASAVETVFYTVRDGALQRQCTAAQRFYSANPGAMLEAVALVPQIDDLRIRVWRNNVGWIAPSSDADMANILGIEVVLVRHDGNTLRRVFAIG
jgi:general secretion pathway protein J